MKRTRWVRWSWLVVSALFLVALFLLPAEAGGVVGIGTPASCTEAALDAALVGGGQVTFNCGPGPVTILLTSIKNITQDTAIDGGSKITLDGGGTTGLFHVAVTATLSLSNLTLTGGNSAQGSAVDNEGKLDVSNSILSYNNAPAGAGGAIFTTGPVTITNSTLSHNAASAGVGGAIYSGGTVTLVNSDLSNNFGSFGGGAIYSGGIMTIRNTSFTHNQCPTSGGAIANGGPLSISGSTFYSNTAGSFGGGLAIGQGAIVTITASTLDSNYAGAGGAGLYSDSRVVLVNSTLVSNSVAASGKGGGAYNDALGVMTVTASGFSGNSAPSGFGGGIYNQGSLFVLADAFVRNGPASLGAGVYSAMTSTVAVTNSTFSDNFGAILGGGLVAEGTAEVASSTFYSNTAAGLVNGSTGLVTVRNSIVANNTIYNCWGPLTSLGHNLESANTCAFAAPGDLTNTNPLLGSLALNGGRTLNRSPLLGSPAINAGSNVGCPATDQRGVPRPQFGTCDIGAVEFVMRVFLPLVYR